MALRRVGRVTVITENTDAVSYQDVIANGHITTDINNQLVPQMGIVTNIKRWFLEYLSANQGGSPMHYDVITDIEPEVSHDQRHPTDQIKALADLPATHFEDGGMIKDSCEVMPAQ